MSYAQYLGLCIILLFTVSLIFQAGGYFNIHQRPNISGSANMHQVPVAPNKLQSFTALFAYDKRALNKDFFTTITKLCNCV